MKRSYYYLIGANHGRACVLKMPDFSQNLMLQEQFKDISLIDLFTMHYSKEEFLKLIKHANSLYVIDEKTDFYILRVTNSKKDFFNFHTYELIYNYSLPDNLTDLKAKIYSGLAKLAQERYNNVVHIKTRKLNLEDTPFFREYVFRIINNIVSNNASFNYFNYENCAVLDKRILGRLIDYKPFKNNLILEDLLSYKKLRGLVVEYLNYLHKNPLNINQIQSRMEYYYPKFLFGLENTPGTISILEAKRRLARIPAVPNLMSQDEFKTHMSMEDYYLEQKIKMQSFDNSLMEEIFDRGGVEAVMKEMDTNDIYNSSLEDLLRLGILNFDEYLKRKNSLPKKRF